MPGAAEGKAQGSGPTLRTLGYTLPPTPIPSAVVPGVWAATGTQCGSQETGDTPGDPSAGFPYSHLGFERFIAAVSLMTEEEELFHGQYNSLLLGAELGSEGHTIT